MEAEPIKLPELKPVMPKQKNKFKPLAIIFIILTILLAVSTGFFVWMYFKQGSDINRLNEENSNIKTACELKDEHVTDCVDIASEWLVIEEWGIKFEILNTPDGDIYYEMNNESDSVAFNSKTLINKGGEDCKNSLGMLSRITEEEFWRRASDENYQAAGWPITRPINGYVYVFGSSQANCSDDDNVTATQQFKAEQISEALDNLVVVE